MGGARECELELAKPVREYATYNVSQCMNTRTIRGEQIGFYAPLALCVRTSQIGPVWRCRFTGSITPEVMYI